MAAPHVVGAAALAWSYYPNATYSEIKRAILDGGDTLPSLTNLVRNGKRLNLAGMMQVLAGGSHTSSVHSSIIGSS